MGQVKWDSLSPKFGKKLDCLIQEILWIKDRQPTPDMYCQYNLLEGNFFYLLFDIHDMSLFFFLLIIYTVIFTSTLTIIIMNSNFYWYLNLKIMAWSHGNIILWYCLHWFLRDNFHNRNMQQCYNFGTYLILAWRHAGKMQVLWIKDHWYGVPVK